MTRCLLSWSTGKDSAWTLHTLRQGGDMDVVALITTVNEDVSRVAMHATRLAVLRAQARAVELPLIEVAIPRPCSNEIYESRFGEALRRGSEEFDASVIAFGDLFLEDVRAYRERQCTDLGITPVFPLWGEETTALAHTMVNAGLGANVSCLDPQVMPRELAGAAFDQAFLDALPANVDPCGEHGEFHTVCHRGPMFRKDLEVSVGETVESDGFVFTDVTLNE